MVPWCGVVLLFFLVLHSMSAFNFAPEFAKVISDPSGDTTSLFGYAVALRKQSGPTGSVPGILVGAPLGNIDHPMMRSVYRPGNIYWCPQVGKQPCKESLLDIAYSHVLDNMRSNRSLSYLGGSLDTLDFGNGFAVCAPRWRNEPLRSVSNMNGMCYWEEDVTSPKGDQNGIFTLYETEYQLLKDEEETIFYAYGEAGFSVAVNQNGGEILIGAPGVFKWKGAVLRYNISSFDLHKPVPKSVYPDSITNESYFGYSVGYGDFPESNHTVYIGGAPRGGALKGKVFMFDFVKNNDVWEYSILKEWEGTQIGEYFGSSLAVADFNQDGFDDLLVGAPQYSLMSNSMSNAMGDEGCVYMFITDEETGWKKTGEQNRLMGLKQHGARFGYAISRLGDINMDGYPDVAIGAPYEDDSRGVVYLYLGSKDGLNLEYSQRLVAQEIDPNLRGFGSSISRGFDVDENYYNDLAIGAYQSNNVVLIKTYPIVTIETEFIPSVSKIGFNDTEFNGSACVTYSGRHAPSKIDVAVTVKADPMYRRANFLGGGKEFSYNVTLEYGGNRDCRNFTFVIEGQKEHYKPFDISMDYKVNSQKKRASDTSDSFCKDCPVLNETKAHSWKVPYGLGCKEDTSCSIDLDMKASFVNVRSPLVIGTEEFVTLQMELESKNDPAYLSKISIIFPRATQHRRLPVDCRENGTAEFKKHLVQLVCDVDGPLKQGMKSNLTLELDMKNIPLNMNQLEVKVTAISSDVDSDESNNHVQLILPLQVDFNVAVNGLSVPEQFAFASKEKDSDVEVIQDKDFTHTFQVNNKGPTPVNSLSLDFKIPYSVYIGKKFVDILDVSLPLIELQRQHLFCKVDKHSDELKEGVVRSLPNRQAAEIEDVSSNRTLLLDCSLKHVRCVDVKCVMDRQFVKKTSVIVSFPVKTKLQQSESLIVNKDRVIAISSCLAKLTETETREKMVQITMWRAFPDTGVAWWIYFLAILAGILVLAAIIWCFYKYGFFKRDKQMQLQAMKYNSLVEQEFLTENSDT